MKKQILFIFIVLTTLCSHAKSMPRQLDTNAIQRITAMLPSKPAAIGDPITKRDVWDKLRDHDAFRGVIPAAEKLLKESIPEKPDSLYLDFSETGNRTRWERVDRVWCRRLSTLFFAECLENKGRFIPALEEILKAYCDERSWVMPAHDASLNTWNGKRPYADLKACEIGMSLAAIRYVMGAKLDARLRQRIKDEVMRRNLDPFMQQITGITGMTWWWITCDNNWNAVCLAGITEAALALIDDPAERALYIVAAATYSKNFLSGFTPDGYCSEGIGYWNYGYGHYVLLTEFIYRATDGGLDLLKAQGARGAARFAGVMEIQNGIHPAFADCSIGSRPGANFMYYLSRRYGFGFTDWDNYDPASPQGEISAALLFSFPNSATHCTPAIVNEPRLEGRTWFPDAGVLICRPGDNSGSKLAAALKGGHNAEHHNHNDVGTYLVVNNNETLLVDPGAEVYTRRTFSSKRYDSKVLNSFGHPVPVIAGKLQSTGRAARGEVISTSFTEDEERLVIEMASAYAVPELKSLQRTFVYSRKNEGSFSVSDRVIFDSPQSFETALITISKWKQLDENTFIFRDLDEGVSVAINTEGRAFVTEAVEIDEDVRRKPTRIGIRLTEPVTEAVVTITVTQDNYRERGQTGTLYNGDFELGTLGWRFDNEMSEIKEGTAASGKAALRIKDSSKESGSNITSARIKVMPDKKLSISGKYFPISGEGVGIYIKYYDKEQNSLDQTDGHGNISPILVLDAGEPGSWHSFSNEFTTPAGNHQIRLWIHSMNKSLVEVLIDDLKIRDSDIQ